MKNIKSEEPIDHWGFLDIKDKVILDLGCGIFYSSISTYEWFLQQGAAQVIGVDLGEEKSENENFKYYPLCIDSDDKLKNLLQHPIDIIKADIEGGEKHFDSVTKEDLGNVTELAIEYHSEELRALVLSKITEWEFEIIDIYQLLDIDTGRMGVVHAKKQDTPKNTL